MMKTLLLSFTLLSGFLFAQMPNIANVWLNGGKPYIGSIGNQNDKEALQMHFTMAEQDQKNDQEYFISGISSVQNERSNFEGKLKITKYKDGKKRGTVYGEYEIAEEPNGEHSGVFKGKFIYTFHWNRKTEKIENQYIEFVGSWANYNATLNYKTNWKN